MTENDMKVRILDLLSKQDATKAEIQSALWETNVRQLSLVLREMLEEKLIYKNRHSYSIVKAEVVPKRRKKKEIPHKDGKQILTLRIVFAIISVVASAVSVRNTSNYLLESYPLFWAFSLSTIMSLFMLAAFGTLVLFWKRGQHMLAITIGILWFVVTTFSMSSTTIGMYNAQKESFVQKSTVDRKLSTNTALLEQYEEQMVNIQKLINDKSVSLARYNKLISAYDTVEKRDENKKDYNALSWSISEAEKFIQTKTAELNGVVAKRVGIMGDEVVIVAKSFYDIMEELFGVPAPMVQFLLSLMASLFIDILAPLAVSLALFLKEEEI